MRSTIPRRFASIRLFFAGTFTQRCYRLTVLGLIACASICSAQFRSLETKDLRLIYYTQAHEFITEHLARCFENAMRFHKRTFDYTPSEKVTIILQDFGDYASGGANTVPFNLIGLGIAPFSYAYETMPPIERMTMMMNHELAHVTMMDKPSPSDSFFRSLFSGKVEAIADAPESMLWAALTSPRWNSPRWFIEGSAVFMETWMNGGLGRALGAYDEMVFRSMVSDSGYFYDTIGLEAEGTKVDFQAGASSYLYGTRFVSYLGLQYGPQKLLQWFVQSPVSKNNFASQFENVYGSPLDEAWARWIAWEQSWQRANLDSVRRNLVTELRVLSRKPLGSVSRAFRDRATGEFYAGVNLPGQTPHLAAIDPVSGSVRNLQHIRGGALYYVSSLAYDDSARIIFYTTDNNQWRDLYAYDVASGDSRLLMQDARIGDLAFNAADRSLWGVRHFNGISTIVRIPYPYQEWKSVYSWDYGKDVFDIDVSPDGASLVAALAEWNGRQRLISMAIPAILDGDSAFTVLYDFDVSTPANFTFSKDGRALYGATYYSGVSNIVRYTLATQSMQWLTNTESGLFRPVPVAGDSLFAFHYTEQGFVPVMLAEHPVEDIRAIRYLGQEVVARYPELTGWALAPPSPARFPLDSIVTAAGEYNPLSGVRVASVYPVVQGYKKFAAYGLRANISDPLLYHRLDVSASYTPNALLPADERVHATLNYKFTKWNLRATYNAATFYDLAGPRQTGGKGVTARASYNDYLIFDEPETMNWSVHCGGYWGLDRLPEFQNVAVTHDRFFTVALALRYSYLERSLGAVEQERGSEWWFSLPVNAVSGSYFTRVSAGYSFGRLLPINHSSLWIRGAAGASFAPRSETLANFYFGGFGNNWLDHGDIRRYREAESFPGLAINDAGGGTFAKLTLEWLLPPLRFRRAGVQNLYTTWARAAFFSSALATNIDRGLRREVLDAGMQVDFRLVLFSSMESTLSLGYALAFEAARHPAREFMVSLKIL